MLKRVSFENYTTFIQKTTIDFEATNSKILEKSNVGIGKVLKGCLFAGENASGKTQVLKGIRILLFLLFKDTEVPLRALKSMYTEKDKFSVEYVFSIRNMDIVYQIGFSKHKIIQEHLTVDNRDVLTRNNQNGVYYEKETKTYENLNEGVLLLRSIYFNTRFENDRVLNEWFTFMKKSLYIDSYQRTINVFDMENEEKFHLSNYIEKYGIEKINCFLEETGYNSTVRYENSISPFSKADDIRKHTFMRKNGTDVDIPLSMESLGNQVLLNLILPILYACEENCMILIDEFSSGLHNELEESLLRYFFTHSKNSQIFFVSHSTNVMKTTILRPDQVYSFHFDHGTIVKRFSDESPRESQNMEKMYLSGVFDGLPDYNKYI